MFDEYEKMAQENAAECECDINRTGVEPGVPCEMMVYDIEKNENGKGVNMKTAMKGSDNNTYEDSFYFNIIGKGRKYLDEFWDIVAPNEKKIRGLIGKPFVGYYTVDGTYKNLKAVSGASVTVVATAKTDDFIEVPDDLSELPFN